MPCSRGFSSHGTPPPQNLARGEVSQTDPAIDRQQIEALLSHLPPKEWQVWTECYAWYTTIFRARLRMYVDKYSDCSREEFTVDSLRFSMTPRTANYLRLAERDILYRELLQTFPVRVQILLR
jgi:hypothetical protein